MKRNLLAVLLLLTSMGAQAQTQEAIQLTLNYEKLRQLEEILDNMYKGYKILTEGYNTIKNIAEGNFNLHQLFLDRLLSVNPAIRNYKRVTDIVRYQQFLVTEYKRAWNRFRNDPNLTLHEIRYIENVYANLFRQSLKNLDDLLMVATAAKLRMSDDERLEAIDRIFFDMEDKLSFLRSFNSSTRLLVIERAKERHAAETTEKLYDINP